MNQFEIDATTIETIESSASRFGEESVCEAILESMPVFWENQYPSNHRITIRRAGKESISLAVSTIEKYLEIAASLELWNSEHVSRLFLLYSGHRIPIVQQNFFKKYPGKPERMINLESSHDSMATMAFILWSRNGIGESHYVHSSDLVQTGKTSANKIQISYNLDGLEFASYINAETIGEWKFRVVRDNRGNAESVVEFVIHEGFFTFKTKKNEYLDKPSKEFDGRIEGIRKVRNPDSAKAACSVAFYAFTGEERHQSYVKGYEILEEYDKMTGEIVKKKKAISTRSHDEANPNFVDYRVKRKTDDPASKRFAGIGYAFHSGAFEDSPSLNCLAECIMERDWEDDLSDPELRDLQFEWQSKRGIDPNSPRASKTFSEMLRKLRERVC